MRLLDRYLVRELLAPLAACLLCFLMFWVGFDVLSRLEEFQREKLRLLDILEYYWVSLPELMLTVMPVGLLLALLYALTSLARNQELTAMRAAGLSIWRLGTPYLIIGIFLSGGLYWLNDIAIPDAAERAMRIRRRHMVSTNETGWVQRLYFSNPVAQRFWNIGAFHLVTGEMQVPNFREPMPPDAFRKIKARSGRWTDGAWWLVDTEEFIYRDREDQNPATRGVMAVDTTELASSLSDIIRWGGTETVISNQLWMTNLTQALPSGQTWRVGAICPTNGEVRDLEVQIPMKGGSQRVVGAFSGVWTNDQWLFRTARELIYRSANDANPMFVPTSGPHPELWLPRLTESPELIRSELKISGLSLSRAMRRPQLNTREIRNYRALHPTIRPELKSLLDTQFHARLAAPWTCFVVVLIAIPFGAPSGRRNIFYGVAGSIGIAFGYFVLQRLGYALSQNGQLPGWLGAWLPNVVFGGLGAFLIFRIR